MLILARNHGGLDVPYWTFSPSSKFDLLIGPLLHVYPIEFAISDEISDSDRENAREIKFPDRETREIGKFLFTLLEIPLAYQKKRKHLPKGSQMS